MEILALYWHWLVAFDLIGGVIIGALLVHFNSKSSYGFMNSLEGVTAVALAIPYSCVFVVFTPMSIISAIWLAIFR